MGFYGLAVASAEWEHFRLSETRFARGAFLPLHRHDDAYLTFVLSGAYRERAGGETRECAARTLVLHPAGDTHEDDFEAKPTRCLNAVLAPAFVRRLGAAAEALDRGGVVAAPHLALIGDRVSAELRAVDDASPMVIEGFDPMPMPVPCMSGTVTSERGRRPSAARRATTSGTSSGCCGPSPSSGGSVVRPAMTPVPMWVITPFGMPVVPPV